MTRKLIAGALAAAGLAAGASGGSAATPTGTAAEAVAQAQALVSAPSPDPSLAYAAARARTAANARGAAIPLPAGGTFNGVRWEEAGGDVVAGTIDGVLAYNATCQWLRAWRQAKPVTSEARPSRYAALAIRVLREVPSWTVFRGTESGAVLAQVAADVSQGGGPTAAAVLADCDAAHAREVAYATRIGLAPST
jgi:hypothetical protein